MGTWVKRGEGLSPTIEDERQRHEDDRLRAEVQRVMTWVLVGSAVIWSFAGGLARPSVSGEVFAAWAWMIAALGVTLRQAIVLWSEEDPRVTVQRRDGVGGEGGLAMLASDEKRLRWWGIGYASAMAAAGGGGGDLFCLVCDDGRKEQHMVGAHPYWGLLMMIGLTMICVQLSVFRKKWGGEEL